MLKEKHLIIPQLLQVQYDNAEYEKLHLEIENILKNLNRHFEINNEALPYISEEIISEFKNTKENALFPSVPTGIMGNMGNSTDEKYRLMIERMLRDFITENPNLDTKIDRKKKGCQSNNVLCQLIWYLIANYC